MKLQLLLLIALFITACNSFKAKQLTGETVPTSTGVTRIGDMVFRPNQLSIHSDVGGAVGINGADSFRESSSEPWTDGIVPVRFKFPASEEQRKKFFDACLEWSYVANVHCIPFSGQKNRIDVSNKEEKQPCWSQIGRGPASRRLFGFSLDFEDATNMNLGKGCWAHETIIHELGHALGFVHEHQRPDRDRYIKVIPSRITSGSRDQYEIIKSAHVYGPYDFHSIMHYSNSSFDNPEMIPLDQYGLRPEELGGGARPTELDGKAMAKIYGPPKELRKTRRLKVVLNSTVQDEWNCLHTHLYISPGSTVPEIVSQCEKGIDRVFEYGQMVNVSYQVSSEALHHKWIGDCTDATDGLNIISISIVMDRDIECTLYVSWDPIFIAPSPPVGLPDAFLIPGNPTPNPQDQPIIQSKERAHLLPGELLARGSSLKSEDGSAALTLQLDGNLVLYVKDEPKWVQFCEGASSFELQLDGNLVFYNKFSKPCWATGTSGLKSKLTLETGGRLVLEIDGVEIPIWKPNVNDIDVPITEQEIQDLS